MYINKIQYCPELKKRNADAFSNMYESQKLYSDQKSFKNTYEFTYIKIKNKQNVFMMI